MSAAQSESCRRNSEQTTNHTAEAPCGCLEPRALSLSKGDRPGFEMGKKRQSNVQKRTDGVSTEAFRSFIPSILTHQRLLYAAHKDKGVSAGEEGSREEGSREKGQNLYTFFSVLL